MSLNIERHSSSRPQPTDLSESQTLRSLLAVELKLRQDCQELLDLYKGTQNWTAVGQIAQNLVTCSVRISKLKELLEERSVDGVRPFLQSISEEDPPSSDRQVTESVDTTEDREDQSCEHHIDIEVTQVDSEHVKTFLLEPTIDCDNQTTRGESDVDHTPNTDLNSLESDSSAQPEVDSENKTASQGESASIEQSEDLDKLVEEFDKLVESDFVIFESTPPILYKQSIVNNSESGEVTKDNTTKESTDLSDSPSEPLTFTTENSDRAPVKTSAPLIESRGDISETNSEQFFSPPESITLETETDLYSDALDQECQDSSSDKDFSVGELESGRLPSISQTEELPDSLLDCSKHSEESVSIEQPLIDQKVSEDIVVSQHPDHRNDRQVTPEDIDQQVTPEDIDRQVTPEDIVPQVTPEDIDPQVTPEDIDRQVTPEDIDPQVTPEDIDRQVTPEDIDPQVTPEDIDPQVTPEDFDPQATPEDIDRQATPEDIDRQATPKDIDPQATSEDSDPQATPKDIDPQATPEDIDPQATPEDIDPQATPEDIDPQATPKDIDPQATSEDIDPQVTPEDIDPQATPEDIDPQATPKDIDPQATPEDIDPQATSEDSDPQAISKELESVQFPPEDCELESDMEREQVTYTVHKTDSGYTVSVASNGDDGYTLDDFTHLHSQLQTSLAENNTERVLSKLNPTAVGLETFVNHIAHDQQLQNDKIFLDFICGCLSVVNGNSNGCGDNQMNGQTEPHINHDHTTNEMLENTQNELCPNTNGVEHADSANDSQTQEDCDTNNTSPDACSVGNVQTDTHVSTQEGNVSLSEHEASKNVSVEDQPNTAAISEELRETSSEEPSPDSQTEADRVSNSNVESNQSPLALSQESNMNSDPNLTTESSPSSEVVSPPNKETDPRQSPENKQIDSGDDNELQRSESNPILSSNPTMEMTQKDTDSGDDNELQRSESNPILSSSPTMEMTQKDTLHMSLMPSQTNYESNLEKSDSAVSRPVKRGKSLHEISTAIKQKSTRLARTISQKGGSLNLASKKRDSEIEESSVKPLSPITGTEWDPTCLLEELYSDYRQGSLSASKSGESARHFGYLSKLPMNKTKTSLRKGFKRRYFRAQDGKLYYYEDRSVAKALGFVRLETSRIVPLPEKLQIQIIEKEGKSLMLKASDLDDLNGWHRHLLLEAAHPTQPSPSSPLTLKRSGVVIIDIGSSSVRAGFAGDDAYPELFFPAVASLDARNQEDLGCGITALQPENRYGALQVYPRKVARRMDQRDSNIQLRALDCIINSVVTMLDIDAQTTQLLFTLPPTVPDKDRNDLVELLFESYVFAGVCIQEQAVLALYSYNTTSGIVVDIGDHIDIVPIIDGYVIEAGVTRLPFGGNAITESLSKLITSRGIRYFSETELYIIRLIKESLCFVAEDYDEDFKACESNPVPFTNAVDVDRFQLPDHRKVITLDSARFRAPEGLFNPGLWGKDVLGVHEHVWKAIQACPIDHRRQLAKSIYLSGATTLLPGLQERLQKEVGSLAGPALPVEVHAGPSRQHAAFIGSSVLGLLTSFSRVNIVSQEEWSTSGIDVLSKWKGS